MALQSSYQATYTSFAGADIVATFDGVTIGELQAISYNVTREKVPNYSMGSPDPRSFSRGKRGIAGSLVFTVLNKDSFMELKAMPDNKVMLNSANAEFRKGLETYVKDKVNGSTGSTGLLDGLSAIGGNMGPIGVLNDAVNAANGTLSNLIAGSGAYFGTMDDWNEIASADPGVYGVQPYYADEIPPFDITITMQNEYGQAAKFSVIGVEILNEGSGMSIDDMTTEKACTFVARSLTPLQPVTLTAKDLRSKGTTVR